MATEKGFLYILPNTHTHTHTHTTHTHTHTHKPVIKIARCSRTRFLAIFKQKISFGMAVGTVSKGGRKQRHFVIGKLSEYSQAFPSLYLAKT